MDDRARGYIRITADHGDFYVKLLASANPCAFVDVDAFIQHRADDLAVIGDAGTGQDDRFFHSRTSPYSDAGGQDGTDNFCAWFDSAAVADQAVFHQCAGMDAYRRAFFSAGVDDPLGV